MTDSTSPSIKIEVIEVLTNSSISPTPSTTDDLIPILTESTLLSSQPDDPHSPTELIQQYNLLFNEQTDYMNFVNTRLLPWKDTTDFKYFHSLYSDYRDNKATAKNLRNTAQKLLEEATHIDKRAGHQENELADHLSTMPRGGFRQRIFYPTKNHPKPRHVRFEPPPQAGPSRIIPSPYVQTNRPRRNEVAYRCYKCDSPNHFKQDCPQYQCFNCKKVAPGHWTKDCPQLRYFNDDPRGHYDIDGYDDGNLNGEC